jgi:transposase
VVYSVVTMFIDDHTYTRNGKTYRRVLLRNSYRVEGKVRHQSIANLSQCSDAEIEAMKLALRHKNDLGRLADFSTEVKTKQGLAVGAVWLLYQLAKRLGIVDALGQSRNAKLGLWMVMATLIEPGSRLSWVRLAQRHAVCDVLGLVTFHEDHLYEAMDWLEENQGKIEKRLFANAYPDRKPRLYLYDVTSSYLEGNQNELADYGYSRDGKKGKKQIVIGLLTDDEGRPISVEVFRGNTTDPKTLKNLIKKMIDRFGIQEVTFVGDRGMIKSAQVEDLTENNFHYVTAITKPQIEKLIQCGVFQMEFFDQTIYEVLADDIRYILRRNPIRAKEIAGNRSDRLISLRIFLAQQNRYLVEHPKSKVESALRKAIKKAYKLKINNWIEIKVKERNLNIVEDEEKLSEVSRLDGCYVIKSDLSVDTASAQMIHDRYKSLSEVEWAFRTMKTTLLEVRGIFVRKAARTQAHVFTIMIAYLLAYELRRLWADVEVTVEEGIAELASLCTTEVRLKAVSCQTVPEPRELGKSLLEKASVTLPKAIPCRGINVVTRKTLVPERKYSTTSAT